MLIVKKGARANRKKEIETWAKEVLKDEEVKIVKAMQSKDTVKIFCKNEKVRDRIWGERERYKNEYDMCIDRWLTHEERRYRYEERERVRELREKNRELGVNIEVKIEEDLV